MGEAGQFKQEKLVVAVLISREEQRESVLSVLQSCFGRYDYLSKSLPFTFTNYYDREMGTPIYRFFVALECLVSPDRLVRIKEETNRVEIQFSENGSRRVNLDPGLLSLSRFVLASTKDSSHRIPLQRGIYAETTLMYEHGSFRPVEWTYPDYRSEEYLRTLGRIREIYSRQLAQHKR